MSLADEVENKIKNVFVTEFGVKADSIKPESRLYADMGLDSIDAIDLVVRLETETGLKLTALELRSVRTFQDVVQIVRRRLQEKK
jgi:acyl carrier protein